MNKRKAKKRLKKIDMWVGLDLAPNRCLNCEYYECADYSVGLSEGCTADYLYDADGNFIEEKNDEAIQHMSRLGWACPCFRALKKRKHYIKPPKSYKEIKQLIKKEREYYNCLD